MRAAAAIASLFVGATSQSITSCGGANDHLQNLKVVITPDPIQKGKSFTLDVTGTMDEDLTGGSADVDLDVKVFSIVDSKVKSTGTFDFAPAIVPKGDAHVTVGPITLPSIPLPGSVSLKGTVKLTNSAKEPILCLSIDLDVPAVDDDRMEDATVGVLDPVPTCTKDSDHMKKFQVQHDKAAHTTDISGVLDEDVSKLSIDVDLKLHVGFLPIPLKIQAPASITPAIKAGNLKWHFGSDQEPAPPKLKIDGQVAVNDGNGEEIVCFNVVPPTDEMVV